MLHLLLSLDFGTESYKANMQS